MYIAKSVCRFAGHNFLKGEVIPDELVLKSKVSQLVKTRVIEIVDGVSPEKESAEGIAVGLVDEADETTGVDETEASDEAETSNEHPEPAKRGRKKKND